MKHILEQLNRGKLLDQQTVQYAFHQLFNDETTVEQIEQFLRTFRSEQDLANDIVTLVKVMEKYALPLDIEPASYFDNCGTGGDGFGTFNISTTSAFVLAAGGVKVAKHGNRKVSSLAGSSDTLDALGIRTDLTHHEYKQLLKKEGIAFLHAPSFHPKLKKIALARQNIETPTLFNLVGPLANPTHPSRQLTGINRMDLMMDYAKALQMLGRKRAIVLCGENGLDEATIAGVTKLAVVDNDHITQMTVTPEEVGLTKYPLHAISGGNATENAHILKRVLQHEESPYLESVLLNAGIGFYGAGVVGTIQQGVKVARDVIASGKALKKLEALQQFCDIKEHAQ